MIPNLFFKKRIPENIPKELEKKIKEFSKSKNKEVFLKKCFFYVVKKWYGHRGNLFLKFNRLYRNDLDTILKTKGYMHCTNMNYIIRVMAVKSGLFKESDIKPKLTFNWYWSIHQYLKIKISENKYVTLDPWGYQFGIDYGKYSSGFAVRRFFPDMKRLKV